MNPIWKTARLQSVHCLKVRIISTFYTLDAHKSWDGSKENSHYQVTPRGIYHISLTLKSLQNRLPWAQRHVCCLECSNTVSINYPYQACLYVSGISKLGYLLLTFRANQRMFNLGPSVCFWMQHLPDSSKPQISCWRDESFFTKRKKKKKYLREWGR